jgi:MTH538 TIR-like domain (DUF1863)
VGIPYRIFISHAYDWRGRETYHELCALLVRTHLDYRNMSVQWDMQIEPAPDDAAQKALQREIGHRIAQSNVLLVQNRPIVGRRGFIQWEIRYAQRIGIPVIAFKHKEDAYRSSFLQQSPEILHVKWDGTAIADAVKRSAERYLRRPAEERATLIRTAETEFLGLPQEAMDEPVPDTARQASTPEPEVTSASRGPSWWTRLFGRRR